MINVIGLGYIGLPTALMMASHGVEVIGTDYNKELVATLNAGKTTFKEEGLDELFTEAVKGGIKFTTEYQKTDMYIVSVPTPYDKFSKKVDACYVVAAVKEVMKVCPKGATVVVESTVSPGTMDKFVRPVIEQNGFKIGEDINLVHAPERIIPGNMVYELLHNNRTIGADSKEIGEKVKKYYASFCQGEIVVTDIRTAEMTKVVENTFRAVNIAFANELARICRHDNMDVYEIIKICNMHPRVNILQPGPGVGGHCISVDPWFLVGDYPSLAKVIDESMRTNDSQPAFVLNRIYEIMKENGLKDTSRVGLYGLTYKENVDDFRENVLEEYGNIEKDIKVTFEMSAVEEGTIAVDADTAAHLIVGLTAAPHGVLAMSQEIPNFVETSTNLASVKMTEPGVIRIGTSQRSCVTASRRKAGRKVEACFVQAGAEVEHESEYPGWAPVSNSPVRDACVASYRKMFNAEPQVLAIHAGLECGLFTESYPELDMISIGPTLRGVHAPGEKLDLASLDKFCILLTDLITNFR